ncbi:hypothetical protein [Staphylococcus gallinarum]|uniref:hypothetical protein n=1 Tax=Staphylococcus gallinarum TaxID=1293 RepID=UPI001E450639|nr:hypothetical protein [Staphylococcus gallinarum]MCD8845221.1 hypothetical protein [Staphylococcus gallinarum]
MFLDIVIDSNSILSVLGMIVKCLIWGLIAFTIINPFTISLKWFNKDDKATGFKFLILSGLLIVSYIAVFCIVYYIFNINVFEL